MNFRRGPARWRMTVALPLLAAAMTLAAGCSDTRSEAPAAEVPQPVRLVTVVTDDVSSPRRLVGRIAPVRTLDLSFQVGGRVAQLPAAPGTLVAQGGLIAALDGVDFELRLRQATAELALAQKTAERARRMVE
ncbi:MAG: biotin/lipoyl-binding protein, partial [Gammaproteobacteria bacterium]|nr:biotin/lipoyl-binding protein [Gammaproteobacteria bacterium]